LDAGVGLVDTGGRLWACLSVCDGPAKMVEVVEMSWKSEHSVEDRHGPFLHPTRWGQRRERDRTRQLDLDLEHLVFTRS